MGLIYTVRPLEKAKNASQFIEDIYKDTEYEKGYLEDLDKYFRQFGITISKKTKKGPRII